MRQFLAFVHKEFYHILRDPRTLLILLGMPIVEMVIFGFALNMEVSHVRTVVMDHAQDKISRELVARISHNPYFDYKGEVYSYAALEKMMKRNQIDIAIITEADTEKKLLQGTKAQLQVIADAADPNHAKIAFSYLTTILADMSPSSPSGERLEIDLQSHMLYNPLLKSSYNFVPGLMGFVLLASPVRPTVMILAKTIPYLLISCVILISILLLSYFVLSIPIRGSIIGIVLLTLIYIFLSLCIGMFISTMVKTQVQAIILSGFGMMMPTLMLSGMIFPLENMPYFLRLISWIVPATWYIEGIKRVMIQGLPLVAVWKELVILASMSISLLVVSILNVKSRLR